MSLLCWVLGRWDEVLSDSYHQLEPCIIVQYLFKLCNKTSKALTLLNVKNSGEEVARYNRLAVEVNRLIRETTIGDKLPEVWAAPLGFKFPQASWESYRQKALQFRQDGA